MKINKLNESSSTAMRFNLVEPTDRKSELKVDKPTAVVFNIFSDEDYDSAMESIKEIMLANGYSAEDLIYVKAQRSDAKDDNSI